MIKHCPLHFIKFFKALCDEQRQEILSIIKKHKEINVNDIVEQMKISQPTVSHHLKVLCDADVVSSRKNGKEVFYSLHEKMIDKCCSGFKEHLCCCKKERKSS